MNLVVFFPLLCLSMLVIWGCIWYDRCHIIHQRRENRELKIFITKSTIAPDLELLFCHIFCKFACSSQIACTLFFPPTDSTAMDSLLWNSKLRNTSGVLWVMARHSIFLSFTQEFLVTSSRINFSQLLNYSQQHILIDSVFHILNF